MRGFGLFVFISLFILTAVKADERFGTIGQYSIETDYQFGRIIPHNSRFKAPVHNYTHSFELGFYKQTLGKKAWQRKLHYPELGGSFTLAYNGDQKIFGNAYIALVLAKFWIVRSRYVDFFVRAGTGLAFAPTHFNLVNNQASDAIGSTVNSADEVRLGLDFKPDPHVQLMLGVTFTHYSNAAFQFPNLGINVPALTMGIRYFPKVSADLQYDRSKAPKPTKKNEVAVMLSMAFDEIRPYGGPRFPIYIATVNYARYTSICNKVRAGASAEFDQGSYDASGFSEPKLKYSRTACAINTSIFVGDEVLIGKVGLPFDVGAYVFNPQKNAPLWVKIGLNYYFVSLGKNKDTKLFVGLNLKTHFLIAAYSQFSAGVVF